MHRDRKYIRSFLGREWWDGEHDIAFQVDENVLKLDYDDGCTALQIY